MLGKLLKHEFTATGRIMLPILGALTMVVLLANVLIRFGDALAERFNLVLVLFVLVVALAVIAVIAAEIMSIVVMVHRFYKNLLGPEGYLMHTLPVNVHQLVWSKLIVSAVWILVTNLVIILLGLLTLMIIGRLNLGELFRSFPSWRQIVAVLGYHGISESSLVGTVVLFACLIFLTILSTCLHFYAAMALGHMFSNNKILMSVVFFIAINVVFSILSSVLLVGLQLGLPGSPFTMMVGGSPLSADTLGYMNAMYGTTLALEGVQVVLMYLATVYGLKKKLNLA
jgi:hypothetical protein